MPQRSIIILPSWVSLVAQWWRTCLQCRRCGRSCRFNSWVGKSPWRKKWQSIPVFSPGFPFSKVFKNYLILKAKILLLTRFLLKNCKYSDLTLVEACHNQVATHSPKVCYNIFMLYHVFILEKAMAPHSSTLAWNIPWMEKPGRLQSMGSLRVGHDWATSLSLFTFMH